LTAFLRIYNMVKKHRDVIALAIIILFFSSIAFAAATADNTLRPPTHEDADSDDARRRPATADDIIAMMRAAVLAEQEEMPPSAMLRAPQGTPEEDDADVLARADALLASMFDPKGKGLLESAELFAEGAEGLTREWRIMILRLRAGEQVQIYDLYIEKMRYPTEEETAQILRGERPEGILSFGEWEDYFMDRFFAENGIDPIALMDALRDASGDVSAPQWLIDAIDDIFRDG